jgi:hypothetical protein
LWLYCFPGWFSMFRLMPSDLVLKLSERNIKHKMITMLIITNPVEQTKQYLPSILIKNQVQDNSQMRLVILNRNPTKLMQSNAIVINKVIRTKDQGHTCLQPQSSWSDCLHLHALPSSRTTNNIHSNRINHRPQTYTKQTNKHILRTKHKSKENFKRTH